MQGDQPQREAREPGKLRIALVHYIAAFFLSLVRSLIVFSVARAAAHLGGVHHHPDRHAAVLRRVAPRRRARGHPGDAYRRQSLAEVRDDS